MDLPSTTKLSFKEQITAIVRDHMATSESEESVTDKSEVDAELKAYVEGFRK